MITIYRLHDEEFELIYGEKQLIEFANTRLAEQIASDYADGCLDDDLISEETIKAIKTYNEELLNVTDLSIAKEIIGLSGWDIEEIEVY